MKETPVYGRQLALCFLGRSPAAHTRKKAIEGPVPSALRLRCIEVMRMNLDARWQKSPAMRKSCARNI